MSRPLSGITGMEKTHRRLAEPDWDVVTWLRSDEGEQWLSVHLSFIYRHDSQSGVFAEVLPPGDEESFVRAAKWPEPYESEQL